MKEKIARPLEIIAALLGVVIGALAWFAAIKANKTSEEALRVSREANDLVRLEREHAVARIIKAPDNANLKSVEIVKTTENLLMIANEGRRDIFGLGIKLIALTETTYPSEDISFNGNSIVEFHEWPVDFTERLAPGGIAHLDITAPILDVLRKLPLEYKNQDRSYHTLLNIVVAAKETKDTIPVRDISNRTEDSKNFTVSFVPSVIQSAFIVQTNKIRVRIYGPTK